MCELTPQMRQELAELRERYENGDLDAQTVSDLMEAAIDAELLKPEDEVNNIWLDACTELMTYVDKQVLASFPDQTEETWRAIQVRMQKIEPAHWALWMKRVVRIAACIVLLFALGVGFRYAWIQGRQEQDDQIFYVEGHEIGLGNEATADGNTVSVGECRTNDFSEFCDFLGYVPSLPTWLPDGWQVDRYNIIRDELGYLLNVVYEKPDAPYLLSYSQEGMYNVDELAINIPQDGAGHYMKLDNGLEIYLTTNVDRPVAVWTTDKDCITVSGPITEDELIKMVSSITVDPKRR